MKNNGLDSYPIIVTGFSLGGALASHVALHESSKNLIHQVWLFNPSPAFYKDKKDVETYNLQQSDPRFYLASTYNDFVKSTLITLIHKSYYKKFIPNHHIANDMRQIEGNPFYIHFRWVLARTMLVYADNYYQMQGISNSRPRKILENSHFTACTLQKEHLLIKPFVIHKHRNNEKI